MKLSTYLMFDGNCREAFTHYHKVLGGKIQAMMDHKGTPAEEHVPVEWRDKILHACLEIEGQLLMASDAGYGFVCTFNDLVARNRAGKALITLPDNAHVMPPLVIEDESDMLLAITAAGRMLMFPVSDLPQLSKGKGNKIISIPAAEAAAGQDGLAHLFILPPQSTLTIHVGKRKIKLRPEELQKVTGERGRRGSLMRGLQKIDRVEIDSPRRAAAGDSEE